MSIEVAETVEQYLARGGKIQMIPYGVTTVEDSEISDLSMVVFGSALASARKQAQKREEETDILNEDSES